MTGPQNWSKLDDSFIACELGKYQSPIAITKAIGTTALRPLQPEYSRIIVDLYSDGNVLKGRFSPGDTLIFDEIKYYLKEMIVHVPAEHRIPAGIADLEIQLLHESEDGHKLYLAIMALEGGKHPEWSRIDEALPIDKSGIKKVMGFWVERILPRRRGYYHYSGSETVPPCAEGVQWIVMEEPITLSGSQIDKLTRLFPDSSRPVQGVNSRKVLHSR